MYEVLLLAHYSSVGYSLLQHDIIAIEKIKQQQTKKFKNENNCLTRVHDAV